MLQPHKLFCKRIIRHTHATALLQLNKVNNIYDEIRLTAMRQKRKIRDLTNNNNYGAQLKIIGSGAPGTPAFLYLLTDLGNYLFNCGESTQRLSQEYHCKLSKMDNVFITSLSWKNIGGLPGLLLTAQDNGLNCVKIHGPEALSDFVENVKAFTHYPNLKICYPYDDKSLTYNDKVMSVTYVQIRKVSQNVEECFADSANETQCHLNENGKRLGDVEVDKGNVNDAKKIKDIPQVLCYICKLHPRPGKLLIQKCIEHGIPPGPLCHRLKHGLDVTKKDGTVIHSSDVCQPPSPSLIFIVIDCPTEEHLDSVINNPLFTKHQEMSRVPDNSELICIFHFTPEEILISQKYQDWMSKFSTRIEHVILNDHNTCMGSQAVHKYQSVLHMLHPEIFPLLNNTNHETEMKNTDMSVHRARAIQTLILRPRATRLTTSIVYHERENNIDEVTSLPSFQEILSKLRRSIDERTAELDLDNLPDYPRIVMLGTGCSVPSKIRNTSGILLRVSEDNSIILDCGEGTLGQITRFYGFPECDNILRSIKAIYISHMHADHHLGVIGLLLRRKRITNDPLYLLVPQCIVQWLNFYNDRFESISQQYILLYNSDLYLNHHELSSVFTENMYNSLKVNKIDTVHVAHCKQSYGIAITLQDNTKIVYSGDTMFSQNLVLLGQDCDLLIHEATMETGLEELAKRKLHSTTAEAISVGRHMNAKFILLTHFSQRYGKIPSLSKYERSVGIAYDNMQFKLPQLSLFDLFYPCLQLMFSDGDECHEDESVTGTNSKYFN